MEDECVEELGRPISSLKVAELRDELTKRALTRTGNKKELIDRLRLAIQRQSSSQPQQQTQSAGLDQSSLQQQQLNHNVPQYIDAAAAIQQNQIAYQHHLNQQIQPQAQLAAATYTMPGQQYPQAMMQPLDLQQSADNQNQVQFANADFQQLQQQTIAEAPHNPEATIATLVSQAAPPIDMRVQQQQQIQEQQSQSIDLSSNAKQPSEQEVPQKLQPQSVDVEASKDESLEKKQEPPSSGQIEEKEPKLKNLEETSDPVTMIETQLPERTVGQPTEIKEVESINEEKVESQQAQESEETLTANLTSEVTDEKASLQTEDSELDVDKTHADDSKPIDDDTKPDAAKSSSEPSTQTSILLKRGTSDIKNNSGSKEKRRKWSSKLSSGSGELQVGTDSTPIGVITGGISSQKLKELIIEKQQESTKTSKDTSVAKESKLTSPAFDKSETEKSQLLTDAKDHKSTDNSSHENVESKATKKVEQTDTNLPVEEDKEVEPTRVLLVQNLVRPFTLIQLKEVLSKHGPIDEEKFWTDKVKSKCCVMYENVEVAKLTRDSLNGQQWPSSNTNKLSVTYITEETLSQYQKSDQVKSLNDSLSNGGNTNEKRAGNSMTDRKITEDGDAPESDQMKKRLGGFDTKSSIINRGDNSNPQELDDLFKKTTAVPHLFWLPLTESEADVRQKEREVREARKQELKTRRSPPRRRSPIRHRSPPRRRSSRGRHLSPPTRHRSRSPVSRRSPPRYRSPVSRRSPPPRRRSSIGRSSPPRRRSPVQQRRSPPGYRRSPPSHARSPLLSRRSPVRSPGPIRRSPMRSPGPTRRSPMRSPGPMRRSPMLSRRSPMVVRRSPLLIRRSPAPPRGLSPSPLERLSSPPRRRSPPRRQLRSPPKQFSPDRAVGGYSSEQRRPQRLDRLR